MTTWFWMWRSNGMADAIVTNNKKHFAAAAKRFEVPVLSPAELWQWMSKGEADAG
jgi:hypothetical protein